MRAAFENKIISTLEQFHRGGTATMLRLCLVEAKVWAPSEPAWMD